MEKNITPWTALTVSQKVEAVRAAYPHTRHTAESIGGYIGNQLLCSISRGSIIGVYNRAAIALQEYPLEGRNYGGTAPKRPLVYPARVAKTLPAPKAHHAFRTKEMPAEAKAPQGEHRNTVDVRARDCRWPVEGQGQDMLYCCEATSVGQSYCAYHKALSLGKGTEGERTALKTLLKSA